MGKRLGIEISSLGRTPYRHSVDRFISVADVTARSITQPLFFVRTSFWICQRIFLPRTSLRKAMLIPPLPPGSASLIGIMSCFSNQDFPKDSSPAAAKHGLFLSSAQTRGKQALRTGQALSASLCSSALSTPKTKTMSVLHHQVHQGRGGPDLGPDRSWQREAVASDVSTPFPGAFWGL